VARSDHFWKQVKKKKLEAEFFNRRDTGDTQDATAVWLGTKGVKCSGKGICTFENSDYHASERMLCRIGEYAEAALEYAAKLKAVGVSLADMTATYDLAVAARNPGDPIAQSRAVIARKHIVQVAKIEAAKQRDARLGTSAREAAASALYDELKDLPGGDKLINELQKALGGAEAKK
jgi:hypothetical protein